MAGDQRRFREHGAYWLARHPNGNYYVWWYDASEQQSRKRSLRTSSKSEAVAAFDRIASRATGGDPSVGHATPKIMTVTDLIEWHASTRGPKLAAKAQMTASVKHITDYFGRRGVSCLSGDTTEAFVDSIRAKGLSLGYAARIVAVLRAAVHRAHRAGLVPMPYDVPNPQTKAERDATPRKGRPMSPEEIATLIDAMPTRHLVAYMRLALSTAARCGAILDLQRDSYAEGPGLIYLNANGRVQTSKYRPTLIAIEPIRPWLRSLAPGYIVTSERYPGARVGSIKTAWRAARHRAGFEVDVTTYSIRYSVAMFMRAQGVPTEDISVQLGHVPVNVKAVTLDYSPYDPDYLRTATAAITEFYAMVDHLVTNPLWRYR